MVYTQQHISYYLPQSLSAAFFTEPTKKRTAENALNLLQQNNEKGFSILYDNYSGALFSVIFQMVASKEIAEDLLQETFIKIWKNKHTYNVSKGTSFTWMLNIARNTAIDYIRSHRNQFYKRIVNDEVWQNEYIQPGTETGNISDRMDYLSLKRKANMLDKKYSIIIDLIYFEGCTFEQVAKLLNLPIGTVKTRGRMALTLLKKAYR